MDYSESGDKMRDMMFTITQLQLAASTRRSQMQGQSDQFYTFLTKGDFIKMELPETDGQGNPVFIPDKYIKTKILESEPEPEPEYISKKIIIKASDNLNKFHIKKKNCLDDDDD
tara:strand:+ start:1927 stop:2268 length:342 start_codon:yes stop_codon:yes gene_type:complete